jgi:acetyl-CoA acetyltransferase
VNQLHRSKAKRAITTMCIGVGQGIAMLIERV